MYICLLIPPVFAVAVVSDIIMHISDGLYLSELMLPSGEAINLSCQDLFFSTKQQRVRATCRAV